MHVMVDIEAYGAMPEGKILTIGAVAFDPRSSAICERFLIGLDCMEKVGTSDAPTAAWWKTVSDEARNEAFGSGAGRRLSRQAALEAFADWTKKIRDVAGSDFRIWGMPAQDDLAALDFHSREAGVEMPWRRKECRCLSQLRRTMTEIFGCDLSDVEILERGRHMAAEDALDQARMVQGIYAMARELCERIDLGTEKVFESRFAAVAGAAAVGGRI